MKMKVILTLLFLALVAGCEREPKESDVETTELDPIVGYWNRGEGAQYNPNGSYILEYDDGIVHGEWRRIPGRLWKFTWSKEALEAINSNKMFAPFIPTYTQSNQKPKDEDVGFWTEVLRGGVYETRPESGKWEEDLRYTVDGDTLIEDQGDYSNHYRRKTQKPNKTSHSNRH